MPAEHNFAVCGTLVDSNPDRSLRIHPNGMLVVNGHGTIVYRDDAKHANKSEVVEKFGLEDWQIYNLEDKSEFLIPGFIDTHIHAPQFPNNGMGMDRGLLDWLTTYTFPMERKAASDCTLARKYYQSCVESTLAFGTTTAVYFATINRATTELLCDIAEEMGQRALVGKVCMNRNSPEDYQETTREALDETDLFISSTLARNSPLVAPVITPRFVPTCDQELLIGLGDLVKKYNDQQIRIQSHLSECLAEVNWVKELEPWAKNYTHIYQSAGLMTNRTIMAHGIYLSDSELSTIKESNSGISHCPNSNNSIRSGSFDYSRVKRFDIHIGLGTDCSGGYAPSILDSIRFAMATANNWDIQRSCEKALVDPTQSTNYSPSLDYKEAFYLATAGGAQVANLDGIVGRLEPGFQFDALRIKMNPSIRSKPANRVTHLFGHESLEDILQKFLSVGDDRNIVEVYVDGRRIKSLLD